MATNPKQGGAPALPDPMQPDLRAFVVYDRLPPECFAFTATDRDCEPHIRPGETVVIDPTEHPFGAGEIFLIQWQSGTKPKALVEIVPTKWKCVDHEGNELTDQWMIGGVRSEVLRTLDGQPVRDHRTNEPLPPMRWMDGPYSREGVNEYLKGRVIGILASRFEEPKRLGKVVQP